ncbi:hypothetical protein NXS19_007954 [Fusarium pseudograminearum]|nr:hypothetical protein NXS19_007954 [Fusarium pseudograminearum]
MTQAAETFDRGKKLQQREKEEQKKTFKAKERECALHGVSPEEMPEHLRPLDTTEALDVHEAILCAGSSNLSRTFKGHAGANALPRMTRELEGLLLYELSSMHPIIDHEANFTNIVSQLTPLSSHIRSLVTYRGDGLLPSTIRVEECHYNDEDSDGKLVVAQGILHAQSLSNICDDHDSKAMMDSGAHRAGVITAFDPRTVKMFDNDPPAFFGNKSKLVWRFSTLTREFSTTHRQRQNANVLESDRQILGIEHIETLLRNTNTGGLHYYYDYFKIDPFVTFPVGRSSLVEWLAIKSPTMIRVLQLLDKHIRQDGNRVLLMVDTLWIQSFVTSLLVHFGYTAITIRTSDIPAARQEVIEKWNDPESDLDVFVGNFNTLNIGVKLHSACHLGIFLNWHLDPTTMEKNFRRLDGPDQREAVQWFLLKQADSYQDNVERLLVQNWIVTSSSKCGLPLWMDNEILEISLCEVMKSLWHQPFNRYAWLVEHEYSQFEMSYTQTTSSYLVMFFRCLHGSFCLHMTRRSGTSTMAMSTFSLR